MIPSPSSKEVVMMAEGRVRRPRELTALDQNIGFIQSLVSGANLQWFSDKLVEKALIDRETAQGIVNTHGDPGAKKVGLLMDRVYSAIKLADNKREKFHSFVDIFSHDDAYCELVRKLYSSVSARDGEQQSRSEDMEVERGLQMIYCRLIRAQIRKEDELRQKEAELRGKKDAITEDYFAQGKLTVLIIVMSVLTLTIAVLLQTYISPNVEKMNSTLTEIQKELNKTMVELGIKEEQIKQMESKLMINLNKTIAELIVERAQREESKIATNLTIKELRMEVITTNGELKEIRPKLRILEEKIAKRIKILMDNVLYYLEVSGPGLTSATVNISTYILVKFNGCPFLTELNFTAQLEPIPAPTNKHDSMPSNQPTTTNLPVVMKFPSEYEVPYTAVSRGQHKLHIQVNNRELNGSPFRVTVYPDPRQLDYPIRNVSSLVSPHGIAINNQEEMIVSECYGDRVTIFDIGGKNSRTLGSDIYNPDVMQYPSDVATDDANNIYVTSSHNLHKFTSNGTLIKPIGKCCYLSNKKGEFSYPRAITVHNNRLYVCDTYNHRIQVFDLDLNFVRSIGSRGKERDEFDLPRDVKFDTAGNMYVADSNNSRVSVYDSNGVFTRTLGQEIGKLKCPEGLYIADKYLYVSDQSRILVYETSGEFVTILEWRGSNDKEFDWPHSITSDIHGFIYVSYNNSVQIF